LLRTWPESSSVKAVNLGLKTVTVTEIVNWDCFYWCMNPVEALLPLLMRAFRRRYCILFQNARAKSEGGQFRRMKKTPQLIVYHNNVPWATTKFRSI